MTTKEKLMQCRRAYAERGAKFIEITHLDGQKSAIANPKAIKAMREKLDAMEEMIDRAETAAEEYDEETSEDRYETYWA